MRQVFEALERLGYSGSLQVHSAPTVLVPDERAHQVLLGFGGRIGEALRKLSGRFGPETPCVVLDGKPLQTTLGEAAKGSADFLVVPRTARERPGGVYGLVDVVDRLLGPGGCPWDQAQTHGSLRRHLIEEAYELVDAIDAGDGAKMLEELGDVLLQPVMHAQMEALAGNWDIDAVAAAITEKLVRRHPHVFGDVKAEDAEQVLRNWDAIKKAEKGGQDSILGGVPRSLPALLRAFEVSKRAARAGFEWPSLDGVWEKLAEEEDELRAAPPERQAEEIGDLLFTVVNLARWMKVEPEDALRQMVDRFTARFQAMEAATERPLAELSAQEWDELWRRAKRGLGPEPNA
ncbi:MAG: nucleoside triphosphate pyrophosphohydrolase [Fimbriimonadaceae bacterium]|nr:nucleoside triphosphate pyrophosphohydrolase [Fimbriimonadaceae bacterium]QYK55466.1 MAG: nucleoside triphosphate pyrophosphohydrolase [Fimbriimonadaceae bacterium]